MLGETKSFTDSTLRDDLERSLFVKLDGDRVEHLELTIPEPSRLFASYLVGKDPREAPAIIERLCGKCPVSYQIPACEALEAAMGVIVSPDIRRLRRLMYCGEWIENHSLHVYLLAPDFVSKPALAIDHREAVERCLRLKRVGEALVSAIGGSARHPLNVAVGGFHRAPRAFELAELRAELEWAVEASVEILRFVATFDFPAFDVEYVDYEMVCLHHARQYPMNEGHVISSRGLVVPVNQFETRFGQRTDASPELGHSREKSYLVGPLARVNMSLNQLSPRARKEAENCGVRWPSGNIFHSVVARALELIHACEEAIAIIDQYHRDLPEPKHIVETIAGEGCYAAEVPSGLTYHRYRVDSEGLIADAKIISPGVQNQKQAEQDLRAYLPKLVECDHAETTRRCEQLVRNYDPGLSGSTFIVNPKNT